MANIEVIMPQMGESITEGTLRTWLKKAGDRVTRDEPLFEISTEKVDTEIPAPASGVLVELKVNEGDTVPVNTVVALLDTDGAAAVPTPGAATATAPASAKAIAPPPATEPATKEDGRRVRSSPLVRKIAREHDIDISSVTGTGLSGRVTRADIMGHVDRPQGVAAPPSAPAPSPAPSPARVVAAMAPLSARVEAMSTMRKKIAEHMVHSKRTSAHVTTVFEMDMGRLADLRTQYQKEFLSQHGIKLTYTSMIAKCVIQSLHQYPSLNASIDGDNVVYHGHVNLGMAVALDWGLIVPVIKRAEEKNVLGLQRAVNDLADRARARKLVPDEVTGGTFTITNPGVYGGLFGTPIISQPQVAILGIGTIEKRPVVINDAIAIRMMCYMGLTFDHRLIDGAVADQFMAHLKNALQTMADVG